MAGEAVALERSLEVLDPVLLLSPPGEVVVDGLRVAIGVGDQEALVGPDTSALGFGDDRRGCFQDLPW
jgi:hypothetical protein